MYIDILSPYYLTGWALGTLSNFLGALSFFILVGTIFGIIIDGIHHWIIEDEIFDKTTEYENIKSEREEVFPKLENGRYLDRFYFAKIIDSGTQDYLINNYYRYSEFYVNSAISLISLALVLPYYLISVLFINPWISRVILIIFILFAYLSLKTGFIAYIEYHKKILDMVYGALGYTLFLEVKTKTKTPQNVVITAQLKRLEIGSSGIKAGNINKKDVNVSFHIRGVINHDDFDKTDPNGVAKTTIPYKKGALIITAASEGLIPGQYIENL